MSNHTNHSDIFTIDLANLRMMVTNGSARVVRNMPGPNDISVASRDRMLALGLIEAIETGLYVATSAGLDCAYPEDEDPEVQAAQAEAEIRAELMNGWIIDGCDPADAGAYANQAMRGW